MDITQLLCVVIADKFSLSIIGCIASFNSLVDLKTLYLKQTQQKY
jgi:hypothetical protein